MLTNEEPLVSNFQQVEELEQFLCNLKLKEDYFKFFLAKGVTSLEKLAEFTDFSHHISASEEMKIKLLYKNLQLILDVFQKEKEIEAEQDEMNEAKNRVGIIQETLLDLEGIHLTQEMIMNGFKMKNKPNLCLPNEFKSEHITRDKIYASFLQDKKIGYLSSSHVFKNLKHLYLNNNKIQILENLHFPSLTILELSNNFIRKIQALETLPNLQSLNLEKNLISKFEGCQANLFLDMINISQQYLTQYQYFEISDVCVSKENTLSSLILDHCNIIDPSNLSVFTMLKTLRINNNLIHDIAPLLECCKHCPLLQIVDVKGNPFTLSNKVYKNLIVLACKNLMELDDKSVTENEKAFVNSVYLRKYGMKKTSSGLHKTSENLQSLQLNIQKVKMEDDNKEFKRHYTSSFSSNKILRQKPKK